jgi:hypothetical protein
LPADRLPQLIMVNPYISRRNGDDETQSHRDDPYCFDSRLNDKQRQKMKPATVLGLFATHGVNVYSTCCIVYCVPLDADGIDYLL